MVSFCSSITCLGQRDCLHHSAASEVIQGAFEGNDSHAVLGLDLIVVASLGAGLVSSLGATPFNHEVFRVLRPVGHLEVLPMRKAKPAVDVEHRSAAAGLHLVAGW